MSVDSAGVQGNGSSDSGLAISADGRYVAFVSYASNLVDGDTNGAWDVFVRDRCPGGSCGGPPITPTITNTPTVTPTATPHPPVVILVHGIDITHDGDASCDMAGIKDFLDATGKFTTDCQYYKTRLGVVAGARVLKGKVDGWKRAGIPKVDIVVHSMGGLVARYYIEQLGGRDSVRSLTMLGTPNLGSKIIVPVCNFWAWRAFLHVGEYDQGACDMIPGNSYLLGPLNSQPDPPVGVSYRVLTGDLDSIASRAYFSEPADCLVPVSSAFGTGKLNFPHDPPYRASHANNGVYCLTPGEREMPAIQSRVGQLLLASNGLPTVALAPFAPNGVTVAATPTPTATPVVSPTEPPSSTIGSQSGVVAQGQTSDVLVTMPGGQSTGTFVFRSPGDPSATLTFALLRPGSVLVGTGDADVTYESGAGFGGLVEAHYTIANPASGTWTMRVTGTTVPATGWPYDAEALVPGGISVTAKAGAGHYDVGQAIALSADVAVNATPYAGATVVATITKPDNTTASVALAGGGTGTYTESFTDTAACGLYRITVTASGVDGVTPFSRQDRTVAFVGVPGNVILDPCVADSDSDGLTDRYEIDISGTNPANADSDGDGYKDKQEIDMAKDPNTYCNIMRADVDGDGAVSILDLTRVAQYFIQSVPPAPERYNQDGDSAISILDLTRMAQVFIQPVSACP